MIDYPKYKIIKDYVINKINTKEYYPNKRIPSENEFTDLLGVSGITVRKAMAELVNEGVIYRVKGKGSFVSDNSSKTSKKLITLLLSGGDLHDGSYMKIIMGMQKFLSTKNYSLIVECSEQDINKEREIILRLIEKNVDGFVLYPDVPERSIENYQIIKSNNIPIVMIDRYSNRFPCNYLGLNNHDAFYLATEYILNLKHKKIAFVAFEYYLSSENERFRGYCDALKNTGLEIIKENIFLQKEINIDKLAARIRKKELTAIMCVNDRRATRLIKELIEKGIKVPEDISIMGFDDEDASKDAEVALSTVRQNFEMLGYEASEMIVSAIEGHNYQYVRKQLGAELVIRKSTSINLD